MTDITLLKAHLLTLVNQVAERGDPEDYKSGGCGELTLWLWSALLKSEGAIPAGADITVMYRLELDNDTDEELDRVISHVMLGLDGDTLDIEGWGADERWIERMDETITPWADNAYNQREYVIFTCPEQAAALFKQYHMPTGGDPILRQVLNIAAEA